MWWCLGSEGRRETQTTAAAAVNIMAAVSLDGPSCPLPQPENRMHDGEQRTAHPVCAVQHSGESAGCCSCLLTATAPGPAPPPDRITVVSPALTAEGYGKGGGEHHSDADTEYIAGFATPLPVPVALAGNSCDELLVNDIDIVDVSSRQTDDRESDGDLKPFLISDTPGGKDVLLCAVPAPSHMVSEKRHDSIVKPEEAGLQSGGEDKGRCQGDPSSHERSGTPQAAQAHASSTLHTRPLSLSNGLPFSPSPVATPRDTPHPHNSEESGQQRADVNVDHMGKVQASDASWVKASTVEIVLQQAVPAISQCMLVTHYTSSDIACLITLKSAPGTPGLALEDAGLEMAARSGSEAVTVMSARSCGMFRRGLALALEKCNLKLAGVGVQIRRFQVLREDFSLQNGLLDKSGSLNRPAILARYRHLVDDMFQHEARYPHKWMSDPSQPNESMPHHSHIAALDAGVSPVDSAQVFDSHRGFQPITEADSTPPAESGSTPRSATMHFETCNQELYDAQSGSGHKIQPCLREPTPRMFSRGDASPRAQAAARTLMSPRKDHQRLPESIRMLSMHAVIAGTEQSTPRQRGRSCHAIR